MTIGVFIVDDSELARDVLRRVMDQLPEIAVVGTAPSVEEALQSPSLARAEVVLLDLWLPGRSGLGVVRQLVQERSVIVVSDSPESSPVGREALAQGASAVFCKADLGREEGRQRLLAAIRAASKQSGSVHAVVAVVGSTGAMTALERLIPALVGVRASLLVLQHMPDGRERQLAEWISSLGIPARPARSSDAIEVGRALVATSGGHLVVTSPGRVAVRVGEPVDGHMPAATALLESAAQLGPRLVVVVLSGMGKDGAAAIPKLIESGATCFALAPEDCTATSMPEAALRASGRVASVRLSALGDRVKGAVRRVGR